MMDFVAVSVTTISKEDVERLVQPAGPDFFECLRRHNVDFDTFAMSWHQCNSGFDEFEMNYLGAEDADYIRFVFDDIDARWKVLQQAFHFELSMGGKGLTLDVGYHTSDEGSRHDDVDGGFFVVDGVYRKTKAARRLGDVLKDISYVQHC